MTISNEAVEAAAKAMAQVETGDDGVTVANDIDRIHARAALEAAAPFIRAGALEDAADSIAAGGNISRWLRARAVTERGEG